MTQKHAYLVMAHNNFYILEKLLRMLDTVENDIYLHIDKSVKNFDFEGTGKICKKAQVFYPKKRINVRWGSQSQVFAELELFKAAHQNGPYGYYHVISGVDLPLKTQQEIHAYFAGKIKSYIFSKDEMTRWDYQRVSRYHGVFKNKWLEDHFTILQEKLKIDRIKNRRIILKRGYNWASLTHEAVGLLLQNKPLIKRLTRLSVCADELYKQTVFATVGYSDIENNDLRFVDWSRGGNHPHVFTMEDFPRLMESDRFFARKFSETVDREVVDKIFETIMSRQKKQG